MAGDVWVVVETLRGEVSEITYTMLAAGRQLADGLGAKLTALVLGNETEALAGTLGVADQAICIDHAELAEFNPEVHLRVLGAVLEEQKPRLVLLGHTAIGTDLACGVAQRLSWPLAVGCRSFTEDSDEPQYSALTCGGKLIATGPLPGPSCVVTVMPGGYKPEDGMADKAPPIEALAVPGGFEAARTRFKAYIEPPAGDVDISKEPILVSVGRGVQTQDNIALAEELAKVLGGVVCGSRPVVDQGWLPTTRLVGKSGKQVKPKLYLALGISGAPEHAEGMRDAELIVAVNQDETAPIYGFAQYGATVNVLELMPALTEVLRKN